MLLSDLFEETQRKHASFCFGRMNPPTLGHQQLINEVAASAMSGSYFVFVSQTQDAKQNPLDFDTKIQYIKESLCPEHAKHIVNETKATTILHAASMLYEAGYTDVTFVAGSDRLATFKKLLEDYNGISGKPHGYYEFKTIRFASSGERDPDSNGISGISGSFAREAALAGDLAKFAAATGAGALTEQLYHAVRTGLGKTVLSEEQAVYTVIANGKELPCSDESHAENKARKLLSYKQADIVYVAKNGKVLYSWKLGEKKQPIPEDAAGVGVIANKKQARDPRYSMSLTRDVRPGETERQLRKMHLK